MSCISQFVENEKKSSGFGLCRSMIRDGDYLVVFINDVGMFEIPGRVLTGILGSWKRGVVLGEGEAL